MQASPRTKKAPGSINRPTIAALFNITPPETSHVSSWSQHRLRASRRIDVCQTLRYVCACTYATRCPQPISSSGGTGHWRCNQLGMKAACSRIRRGPRARKVRSRQAKPEGRFRRTTRLHVGRCCERILHDREDGGCIWIAQIPVSGIESE